jgi:ubiquinone/menaquinone biosynthesis C-methylase UbiE
MDEKVRLERRRLFQEAVSPEEIKFLYQKTLKDFPIRYKHSTIDYANQGVPEVIQRKNYFNKIIPPGKIADLGSGDGYFAIELGKIPGRKVFGVDMLEHRVKRANETAKLNNSNSTFVHGFAEEVPYETNFFDTTILSHMLEHVHNPEKVLNEAMRITKSKGQVIVIVPHDIGYDPTHIRAISPKELKDMLKPFGRIGEKQIVGTKGYGYVCTLF